VGISRVGSRSTPRRRRLLGESGIGAEPFHRVGTAAVGSSSPGSPPDGSPPDGCTPSGSLPIDRAPGG
jgi:hypothetical protein